MFSRLLLIGKVLGLILGFSYKQLQLRVTSWIHRITYRRVSEPRNIVVIGASFAGYQAAYFLANSVPTGYQVVVVEKNSHFQFTWVFPRFCVVEGHENKAFVPYGSFLSGAPQDSYRWVKDRVERIEAGKNGEGGHVKLGSGECIAFEYLVLATGSSAGPPSRLGVEEKHEGIQVLQGVQKRLKTSNDIVILGGGPAGVELASDTKALYPEKKVTLVHSRTTLLNSRFRSKLHKRATEELKKLGANLVLGDRLSVVDAELQGDLVLSSGKKLSCDSCHEQIKCVGQRPNLDLVRNLSPSSITPSSHIKVRPTLQLADAKHGNIYAAGDVVDINEARNGRSAVEQAQVAAQNIVRAITHKELLEYKPKWWEGVIKLTLGLEKSVVYLTDGSAELTISSATKEMALDSARVWQYFGAKPFTDPFDAEDSKC